MSGGLYKNIKMSLKTANVITLGLITALIIAFVLVVKSGGFIVSFDVNGGTDIEPIRVMHGEQVNLKTPTKQGRLFKGWYTDEDCTILWQENSPVTESMTLYAKWE